MRSLHRSILGYGSLAAGLTVFQLIGRFKRMAELTPHAYLTQLRLGMRLLRPERAHYGVTPLQFARASRKFHRYGLAGAA